ncbi:MAG TPA: HypC/HybG/HupF family hydrogenase formation chaperone [Bacteroidales bacterium]|nr:HypC/HybG/HupF family hydrogenase formation chaperone [Bacteroidales bacterium]
MCLSIPGKVIEIDGIMAKASVGGTIVNVGLHLVDDVRVGDYVLIHTGFALQKVSEEEALETLKLIKELQDPDNHIY